MGKVVFDLKRWSPVTVIDRDGHEIEAFTDGRTKRGKRGTKLQFVNYLYIPFRGWVRSSRVRPRPITKL